MVEKPRIDPLEPPYERDVAARLEAMMPAAVPPIVLFRTFAKNLPMAKAMGPEVVSARCGCEYEWGVHIAFFADRAVLNTEQVASLTRGQSTDQCWTQASDRLLIETVDSMHESGGIPDDLFEKLASIFSEAQILDLAMLCGWYHAISFTANVSRVQREPGAPQFSDF
jgi:hypothetical protein